MGKKLTHKEFIERLKASNKKYQNKEYDIVSEYNGSHNFIRLEDRFGFYNVKANDLLKNTTSPSIKNVEDINNFIFKKFEDSHGNLYSYKDFVYTHIKQKITIECKNHGFFKQSISHHINGSGCPKCSGNLLEKEDVFNKAKKVHNNKYTYPDQEYINAKTELRVICPIHGEFKQVSDYHLNGCGCRECSNESRKNNKGGYNTITIERNKDLYLKTPCKLYFIKMYDNKEKFYKIGITIEDNINNRFVNMKTDYIKEVVFIKEGNLYECFLEEQKIIEYNKKFRYYPLKDFIGKTECFDRDIFVDCQNRVR